MISLNWIDRNGSGSQRHKKKGSGTCSQMLSSGMTDLRMISFRCYRPRSG